MRLENLRWLAAAASLTLAQAAPAAAQEAKSETDVSASLASFMKEAVDGEGFSGSVIITRAGEPLLRSGYGLANLELSAPNEPGTKFRLGSVTKQFTAMAVLILAERGALGLDDPISSRLDDAPETWKPITVRHLLNHTSGIPNFTDFPDYAPNMRRPQTHAEMVARFRDKPLDFEPGSKFSYSNSGYYLLGLVIEKAAGKSYEDFLREAIFQPLGLNDTGYDHSESILPSRAAGYERAGEGGVKNASFLDMSQPFSAGALYSTVDDLSKWDRALAAGKLISSESYEQMFRPAHDGYAFGWMVAEKDGRVEQGHGGGINGFNTIVLRYPSEDTFVAVLSNVTPTALGRIARGLAAISRGEQPDRPKQREVATVDPKIYDHYVGRYALAPTFIISVTREGDRLFVQATDQPKFEVFPESQTDFFLKVVDAQITFVQDADGPATHLILHQGGADQKAERVKE